MKKELEPLDPELRRLLDAEADFPPEDPAMSARVWQGVERALVLPPAGGAASGGDGSGSGAPPPPAGSGTLSKYLTVAALAFLAGGITGAIVHGALTPAPSAQPPAQPPAPIAETARAPIEPAPLTPPPPVVAEPEPAPSAPATSLAAQPSASAKAAPVRASDLARERAIIEVARTAVARGRTSAALAAIERHAREFPKGQLVEEREGLRVIALGRAGRAEDAREKADAFRKKYPKSVLLPATEAAVESKPRP